MPKFSYINFFTEFKCCKYAGLPRYAADNWCCHVYLFYL